MLPCGYGSVVFRRRWQLNTSGLVDDDIRWASWSESSTTLYFEEVRQLAVPVGCETATVFGIVCGTGWGAKSVIYDCLVLVALTRRTRYPAVINYVNFLSGFFCHIT